MYPQTQKVTPQPVTRTVASLEASVEYALAADDFADAIDLIASAWPRLAALHGAALRSLIARIPEQEWHENAWIIAGLGASYRSVSSPSRAAARPHFQTAERLIDSGSSPIGDLPAILLHHAACLRSLGLLDSALAKAESAWAMLQAEAELTFPLRLALQANASLQLGLIKLHLGDIGAALDHLRLASGLSEQNLVEADRVECFSALAFCAYLVGDFDRAEQMIGQTRSVAGASDLLRGGFGTAAIASEVLIAADRNDPIEARSLEAELAASARDSEWEPLAYYARAAIAGINGQLIEALDLQRHSATALRTWENTPLMRSLAEILRGGLHLHLGEKDTAEQILYQVQPVQDHAGCAAGPIASIRFGNGDFVGCLAALAECHRLGDAHSSRTLVDVLLLSAAAHYELGNAVPGDVAFDRALYLGGQTGIRVPFLVIPRVSLLRMLDRASDRYQPDAVHRLLTELRVGRETGAELVEPLSERELDIAQHLFQDKTVNQIAAELFISSNTVKTHVRSIYRKLSASSRKEAIRRVHELGLDVKITPF